ncbi:MAG: hypothetical protein EXR77_14005 [Myxococcales bacterium]|nr:hypothetical protein [Myxococcales bacterium]
MRCLALAAPGTLNLVAAECHALNLKVVQVDADGVHLELNWKEIAFALVQLRIASRLLLHLGVWFADDGESLYKAALHVDWAEWLDFRSTFGIFATGDVVPAGVRENGRKFMGLTDMRFVNVRVKDAIADEMMRRFGKRPDVDRDDPVVAVMVRGRQGKWAFYLDLADPPLTMRGVCEAKVTAPLRENVAAAMVDLSGWRGRERLLDPMCGSGTIVIEAACKILGIAPGCTRSFACERWPHHGKAMRKWLDAEREKAVDKAKTALATGQVDIVASDIDPYAVQAARRNVEAAGLDALIDVQLRDARELPPQPAGTLIVTNPPYGERMGGASVANLYAQLGQAWRSQGVARACVLSGSEAFAPAFDWRQLSRAPLNNGGIDVELLELVPG